MWRFRLSVLQLLVIVAVLAVVFALKVYKDRSFRAFCIAKAQPHLDAAAEAYRLEAALRAEARTKTGYEARFLIKDAAEARARAQAEERIAAICLKGTGIDPIVRRIPNEP